MLIQSTDEPVDIDYDELATLKQLAAEGALNREIKISNSSLAESIDISAQSAGRRLQKLWDVGLIYRQPVNDGQYIFIRKEGEEILRNEYREYRAIFATDQHIELQGTLVEGLGEGKHFVSLSGYNEQFAEKLGYEPFAGTLNVELSSESVRTRRKMRKFDPIRIAGWQDDDTSFGPVYCYPGKVDVGEGVYRPIHVVVPERTEYDEGVLELVAPEKLREKYDLDSGDQVTVYVDRD